MSLRSALSIGALIALVFSWWIYGLQVLRPDEFAWLLHGDPAQHLLGATQFLAQPWQWPPGAIALQSGQATSIVFMDAVPLAALLAKAIQWPASWQYFGIWIWCSHVAVVVMGLLLLNRLGLTTFAALVGACFFLLSPMLLLRAYGHEALMAHWLILWSVFVALSHQSIFPLVLMVSISLLTHPYLGAMGIVFGTLIIVSAKAASLDLRMRFRQLLLLMFSILAVMWLAGYFHGSSERSAAGYGFFSANLLTWFDPMNWLEFLTTHGRSIEHAAQWSSWFIGSGQATAGQYEGFAYLGSGMLLLVGIAFIFGLARILRGPLTSETNALFSPLAPWLVMAFAMALFAVSSTVTLGPNVLIQIAMPQAFSDAAGVFRASGRFIWPLTYFLMLYVIVVVGRHRYGLFLIAAALVIQGIDLAPKLSELRSRFHHPSADAGQPAQSESWSHLFEVCPRLVVVGDLTEPRQWAAVAIRAAALGAEVDGTVVARPQKADAALRDRRLLQLLQTGQWRADTVYLLVPGTTELGREVDTWIKTPQRSGAIGMQDRIIDGYYVTHAPSCR